MTEDHNRSRLDGLIDAVVRDMMQVEPRDGLAGRVRHAIESPAPRRWTFAQPAFAAAALVLVAVMAAFTVLRQPAAPDVPTLSVVSGPPTTLDASIPTPDIPTPPPAAASAGAPAPTRARASAESIFGERGRVSAASVRSRVRLVVTLTDLASPADPQELSLVTVDGERGEARIESPSGGRWRVTARPQVLASGEVQLQFEIVTPVQQRVDVTLAPGKRTRIAEAAHEASGRRYAVDAVATLLGATLR